MGGEPERVTERGKREARRERTHSWGPQGPLKSLEPSSLWESVICPCRIKAPGSCMVSGSIGDAN